MRHVDVVGQGSKRCKKSPRRRPEQSVPSCGAAPDLPLISRTLPCWVISRSLSA